MRIYEFGPPPKPRKYRLYLQRDVDGKTLPDWFCRSETPDADLELAATPLRLLALLVERWPNIQSPCQIFQEIATDGWKKLEIDFATEYVRQVRGFFERDERQVIRNVRNMGYRFGWVVTPADPTFSDHRVSQLASSTTSAVPVVRAPESLGVVDNRLESVSPHHPSMVPHGDNEEVHPSARGGYNAGTKKLEEAGRSVAATLRPFGEPTFEVQARVRELDHASRSTASRKPSSGSFVRKRVVAPDCHSTGFEVTGTRITNQDSELVLSKGGLKGQAQNPRAPAKCSFEIAAAVCRGLGGNLPTFAQWNQAFNAGAIEGNATHWEWCSDREGLSKGLRIGVRLKDDKIETARLPRASPSCFRCVWTGR